MLITIQREIQILNSTKVVGEYGEIQGEVIQQKRSAIGELFVWFVGCLVFDQTAEDLLTKKCFKILQRVICYFFFCAINSG